MTIDLQSLEMIFTSSPVWNSDYKVKIYEMPTYIAHKTILLVFKFMIPEIKKKSVKLLATRFDSNMYVEVIERNNNHC